MNVLIADDHPLFRMGLRYALSARGFTVVCEAADGVEALEGCAKTHPEAALLDIKMPRMDGIEACRCLMEDNPILTVILLTTFSEPAIIASARKAGAKGFLSKDTEPGLLAEMLSKIVADPERDWMPPTPGLPNFTPREQDVLKLLLGGKTNKRIASVLGLSPDTVKDYVSRVLVKLEVGDRMGALRRARELGLG